MSYVTNPIANRLGVQQGWYNPLISLQPGLTNTSFITYLKCYLLMQEYLRHNQINLIFFEIKPLQKNKKLFHLFVYKNISYLEKNELTFGSRNELNNSGFLKLAMYLSQQKIKLHKFKSKKSYGINSFNFYKNYVPANRFAELRNITKLSLIKSKAPDLQLYAGRAATKAQTYRRLFKFNEIYSRPSDQKNDTYYKKKRLVLEAYESDFIQADSFKQDQQKRKNKRRWHKTKSNYNADLELKLASQKLKYDTTLWLRKYSNKRNFKSNGLQTYKIAPSYLRLAAIRMKDEEYAKTVNNVFLSSQKYFLKSFSKTKFDQNKVASYKKAYETSNQSFGLVNEQPEDKEHLKIQNDNWSQALQIRNWFSTKYSAKEIKQQSTKRYRYKKFKKMWYILRSNLLCQPILPKISHFLFSFRSAPKSLQSLLWRWFEKSKLANPLQFIFFINSYAAKKNALSYKLQDIKFRRKFNKLKKIQLVWKNRAFYDFKSKKELNLQTGDRLPFTRYMSFINSYRKQQRFYNPWFIKNVLWAGKFETQSNDIKPLFFYRNFETQFQKLNIEFRFFIEKYIQQYLRFPVIVKIKNVNSFIDSRSNRNTIDYTKQNFLKSLVGKSFFIRLLHALLNTERIFNPQIFIDLIATEMQKTNNYKKLVRNMVLMFSALHSEHIMGYKIVIDGKLGGSKGKSTKQIFKMQRKEKIPVQTFTKNISYALGVARTSAGLFGIRMWLYY